MNILSDGNVEVERWDTFRNEEILPRWYINSPCDHRQFQYAKRDELPGPYFETDSRVKCFI